MKPPTRFFLPLPFRLFRHAFLLLLAAACLLPGATRLRAAVLFSDDFNAYAGTQNATQYQTGLNVAFGGNLPLWSKAGSGTVHAVDRTGAGDWAVMFFTDNVITLTTGIDANNAGTHYAIKFQGGPAVYAAPSQTTAENDGMVFTLLRNDDSVLATFTYQAGAWAGAAAFTPVTIPYVGDGSGPVRLRISPLLNSGHFAGAIDSLTISDETPIFADDFNAYAGNQNAGQYQTGLKVAFGGNLPAWTKAGSGTVHAVDRSGSGDWAVMFFTDNVITLTNGINANNAGVDYAIKFLGGPAVYNGASQTTSADDGLVFTVLRGDDSVLSTSTYQPGAWAGAATFTPVVIPYVGDGSGPVRLRISPLLNSGHFAGAIDQLTISEGLPPAPPEITTHPAGGNVIAGDDFVLTVVAPGLVTYQWFKGADEIPGATRSTYRIVSATADSAGTYKVVVTNPQGSVPSTPAVVTYTPVTTRSVIFLDNFSGYTGNQNNLQYQTGLKVSFGGALPLWSKSGFNGVHAVDRDGAGNYALMVFYDNVITLANPILANEAGVTYYVDYTATSSVYAIGTQATQASDAMIIDVLRGDDSVLVTQTVTPGAWNGTGQFTHGSFQYIGDGTGAIRLRVGPQPGTDRFVGAIDSIVVSSDLPPAKPRVVTPPANVDRVAGEDFTLSANVEGALSFEWRKGNIPIPGATGPSYTVVDARPEQSGAYTLVVTNSAGTATSDPATVTITPAAGGTIFFSDNFNAYAGNQNALQFLTNLKVSFGGTLPLWNRAGSGTVHAVDRTGTGNYAVMFFFDNVITLASGVDANETGVAYFVDLTANGACYNGGGQANTADEGVTFEILRSDDSVLATHDMLPGAFSASPAFTHYRFQYEGDGSGPIRVRARALAANQHFGGAIDNLTISSANQNPFADADTLARRPGENAQIAVELLLANDFDADLDAVHFSGVSPASANGGTVTTDGTTVFYTPPAGADAADSFTYTINDGHGGTATGTVNVTIAVGSPAPGTNLIKVQQLANGTVSLLFGGVPAHVYRIESNDTLNPATWQNRGTVTADALGNLPFLDPPPLPPARFYRTVAP